MKHIRQIELIKCDICGREFDSLYAYTSFTGRMKHICPECHGAGEREINGMHEDWKSTNKGKTAIEYHNRNK